jgi:nucleotide-binding universal stress UspA family protein
MQPFKKILVPIDFSAHSEEAMRVAADLASHYKASLTLVYVYEPMQYALPEGYILYTPDQVAQMTSAFQERLARAVHAVEALGLVQVESRLLQGIVSFEIADLARNESMDLIVMGTHGRTGVKRALMGSVAERVLRTAPCPVLVVKGADAAGAGAEAKP